jgi:RimJ/RimL family protein N-acetyltransferase
MQIVAYAPDHLARVIPQCAQGGTGLFDRATAESLAVADFAFSAVADGRIVGCAGVMPLWPGVGHAWAVLSDAALARPITLTRAVQRELTRIEIVLGLQRLQATVADGHVAGRRWLAWLGFEVEGLMCNYGPGGVGDYWLYGRAA